MPVIKSAIKKLRKDKNRENRNDAFRQKLDTALRLARKLKSPKAVSSAVSLIDKGVKNKILHKNRAARIKSALSKLSGPDKGRAKSASTPKTVKKPAVKAPKTKSSKTSKK